MTSRANYSERQFQIEPLVRKSANPATGGVAGVYAVADRHPCFGSATTNSVYTPSSLFTRSVPLCCPATIW